MSRKSNLAQIWAERIAACQASGIKVKSWCRERIMLVLVNIITGLKN